LKWDLFIDILPFNLDLQEFEERLKKTYPSCDKYLEAKKKESLEELQQYM
jgi:hypothetical protein